MWHVRQLWESTDLHIEIEGARLSIALDDAEFDRNIGIGGRKRR